MKLLLDTHALLWALSAPEKLSSRIVERLEDADTVVFASAATMWEIAIKATLGKLEASMEELVHEIGHLGFLELPVSIAHTERLRELPTHHPDPFDRILVAQALTEGLTLVSSDPVLRRYPAHVVWE